MDLNLTAKKVQENTQRSKGKAKRAHSPGNEDEKPVYKKLKRLDCLENISPAKRSLLPDVSRTSLESCKRRIDESNLKSRNKQEQRGVSGPTGSTNGLLDLQLRLQRNFKMLKEKMEPTGLAEKFHKMGILNSKSVENVQSGSSREKKNETLIKEICNIKPDSRKDVTYEMFVSYLEETGQGNIVSELRQSMHKRHILGIQHNERHNLMRFFHEMKDVLLDEVEPRIFIDKIVAIGGITIDEHEEITTKSTRRQRIRVLIEKIKSSVSSVSIWIINGMVEAYPGIYTAFKKQKNGNRTTTKEQDDGKQNGLVSIGSSVQMKYQISTGNTLVVEDQNEHDDPMSKMKRMRRQAEEIERRMVDNVNEDLSQLDTLLEHCITGIEEVKFSSIKIHLKALSKHSLDKLVTYSRSSAAKKLFLSLIDDETRQKLLDMKAKIVVEIINGCKDNVATATFENDCLCTLDKERVANNRKALTAGICCSKAVINRFVESHLTDAKTKAFLKKIKPIPKRKERNKKLLQFLLQSDSPVFFCILEEEIIKHGGAEIIRATNRDHLAESEKVKPDTLNKADIQINKDLLFKELEVQWFISHLEKRKDTATQKLLVKIRASESRDERLGPFIEYISKAQDLNWFFEEIKTRHMHLYDTLLSRKTSNNTSSYESVDFKRLEAAVHFFYDEIIEEVDPLVLTKWLGNETKQEVHFSKLRNVHIRSKRASRFCLSLLGVSPKSLHDVLSAMKACGYKEIVDDIIRLAREGPLNDRYMCPKIKSTVQCKETCVYKDSFNFDENCIEDLPLPTTSSKKETQKVGSVLEDDTDSCQTEDGSTTTITQNSTLSDARNDKAVCQDSSLRLKEIRKHFHIEGSESGIFSGSGFCMEDTISNDGVLDYERKTSDIDRSKRTKEWIESHSKSKSFGISTQPGSAAHMSTDETTGVLQEEKGTFKKFTTPYLPHWYARN